MPRAMVLPGFVADCKNGRRTYNVRRSEGQPRPPGTPALRRPLRYPIPSCGSPTSWRTFRSNQERRFEAVRTAAVHIHGRSFMTRKDLYFSVAAVALAAFLGVPAMPAHAQQAAAQTVAIDSDDIGGVVASPKGPEAGVWVIAETNDLPTKFARIVVTDDQGRYVIPDLPTANYQVWVRGYGLIDSPKLRAKPGQHLNLMAVPAPNDAEAAHYYPAIYWYSMMKIPAKTEFGKDGSGMPP